jgi:HSP20 family protein
MSRSSHWRRDATNAFHLLQDELNRLLEEYLQPSRFSSADSSPTDLEPTAWSPPFDVYETPEELLVIAEVPGVDPASIDLAITGNTLTLRGVKKAEALPGAAVPVCERVFGAFHRQVTIPNEVDLEHVVADASHGVLRIRLPKRSAAKPRTIPIRPA